MGSLLRRWVPDGAEIVVATSWGEEFSAFLDGSARTGAFDLPPLPRCRRS
jgi:carbamoyltransferase